MRKISTRIPYLNHCNQAEERGRASLTWKNLIEKDLKLVDIKVNLQVGQENTGRKNSVLLGLAEDRREWRKLVKHIMAVKT